MYIYKGLHMLELGISQAQAQFTKILNKSVVLVDKKTHKKKAVILPYEEYQKLLKKSQSKEKVDDGVFSEFVGMLDENFKTDDPRYNKVI